MDNCKTRKFSIRNISLALKILIPIIFFTAVIFPLFTVYLIDSQRRQSEIQLASKAQNLTYLLAYANINNLWNYDYNSMRSVAKSFFEDRDLVHILIQDNNGNIQLNLRKEVMGSKQILKELPIKKDGETLGLLKTRFTNYHIEKNLTHIRNNIIMLSLIIFAVISLFIIVISKMALKPLGGVLEGIRHVANGDYHYQIQVSSNDEIGQVTRQFNQMSTQIISLQQAAVQSAEAEKEMEIAKNIQMSLQPSLEHFKHFGFQISASMTPAEDVGGDYYDIIESCDQKLWIGIGDVTGHGLVSGLVMMMVQVASNTLIRSIPNLSPESLLSYVNKIIQRNIREGLKKDHHVTINFIKQETDGRFRYAGAHEIILIYRAATRSIERIKTKGMWLGVMTDISDLTRRYAGNFALEKNDILFLYTDGVIEIKNHASQQYDLQRLEDFIKRYGSEDTEIIKRDLLLELNQFKAKQLDDITFLIMKKE